MTKDYIISQIRMVIKTSGVNGYYIYFEQPIKLANGRLVDEVRVKSKAFGIDVLEQYTNRVIPSSTIGKKDYIKIYNTI